MCKVYTVYCGTSEIEHGLCACTVDNPLAKTRGLSLRTGAQTMLYLPLKAFGQPDFSFENESTMCTVIAVVIGIYGCMKAVTSKCGWAILQNIY